MCKPQSIKSLLNVFRRNICHRNRCSGGGAIMGLVALGSPCVGWAGIAPPKYNVVDLTALVGSDTFAANAINDSGQVVGEYINTAGQLHGFLYSGGSMHDLGANNVAHDINADGVIVGSSALNAFVYQNGAIQEVPTPAGMYSTAYGINASGRIVGSLNYQATGTYHAFLYDGGTMHDLGTLGGTWGAARAINDAGQIVGDSTTADSSNHAFLYSGGQMHDLGTLGGTGSRARAIDSRGDVVGSSEIPAPDDSQLHEHAFLYSNGVMTDLGALDRMSSAASGINDSGQIVGESYNGPGLESLAFLYQDGTMYDLNTLLTSNPGYVIADALGINNSGQIVGIAAMPNGQPHAVLLTPALTPAAVPLPAAAWMGLGTMGLLAAGALCRQRHVRLG